MVVTIDCRDTINCKVTIVLCNRALDMFIIIVITFYGESIFKPRLQLTYFTLYIIGKLKLWKIQKYQNQKN